MLRLHCLGIGLCAAVGCSPVKDFSNVPDAAIDAMDMRGPMVASSFPADMATKISVLQTVAVYLDEPLDAASVSAATVKLAYRPPPPPFYPVQITILQPIGPGNSVNMLPVKGTVTYDAAAKKIVFDPAAPLAYGAVHHLQLDVKDTAGLPLAKTITFTTYVNAQTKQFSYNGNGQPSSWLGNPTNMDGRWTKRVGGSNPGIDTIWFTGDDPRNQHFAYNIAPDGRLIEERGYSPGSDSQYDTTDDILNYCIQYKYDMTRITERLYPNTPGPDNTWCTTDDLPLYLYQFTYTGPTTTGYVLWTGPGTDNTWRTTDDRCGNFWEHEYDAQTMRTREAARTCGTDGVPHTADDQPSQYYKYTYDADGQPTRQEFRTGVGPDMMWFTDDDIWVVGSPSQPGLVRWTRDASGRVTDQINSTNTGTDTMWGTADDVGARTATTYNMQGLAEKAINYLGPGTDNMWGTTDDVIASYIKFTYDANGNRTDAKTYNSGTDAIWENADDKVILDLDFDITR